MRRLSLPRQTKSAFSTPFALLMVALLVVVHPASQWLCFFMPCGVQATQQSFQQPSSALQACCRNAKVPPTTAIASCCKQKQAATSDCGQLPIKSGSDAACCGDARNQDYLSGETQRLAPKVSDWEKVSYPLVAVLPPGPPDVAPKIIRHTLRDGATSPPASPFLRPARGRAPPELA